MPLLPSPPGSLLASTFVVAVALGAPGAAAAPEAPPPTCPSAEAAPAVERIVEYAERVLS
jgi:hypothetical protein